jgi:CheY-like chemotaxis protein
VQIAVVDNEPQSRDFILNVMAYCVNREVLSFENTDEMVAFLEQGRPIHLLLAKIPPLDSNESKEFKALKTIKQKFPQTRLIATSANADDCDRAEKLGADVFLAKPFVLHDLFKIVQDYVVDKTCETTDETGLRN